MKDRSINYKSIANQSLLISFLMSFWLISAFAWAIPAKLNKIQLPTGSSDLIRDFQKLGTVNGKLVLGIQTTQDFAAPKTNDKCLLVALDQGMATLIADLGNDCSDTYKSNETKNFLTSIDSNLMLVAAYKDVDHRSLWITDGTPNGTKKLQDSDKPTYGDLFYHGKIYSTVLADYNSYKVELYLSDTNGSAPEKIIENFGSGISVSAFLQQNKVLIQAGFKLYSSDGTKDGTKLIFEASNTIPQWSNQSYMSDGQGGGQYVGTYKFNPSLSDGTDGATLQVLKYLPIVTDGSAQGTFNFNPEALVPDCDKSISNKNGIFQIGDALFYTRCTQAGGRELASFDLKTRQVRSVKALPDIGNTYFGDYTGSWMDSNHLGRIFLFNQKNSDNQLSLWRTDGTESGTYQISDLTGKADGINTSRATSLKTITEAAGSLYFWDSANTLWVSDGSQSGTYRVPGIKYLNTLLGYVKHAIDTESGLVIANIEDYLISEFAPENTSADSQVLSIAVHNPAEGKTPAMVLLAIEDTQYNYSGYKFNMRTMASGSDYIFAIPRPGGIDFFSTNKDLCPGDDQKLIPGFCGCGVEEHQIDLGNNLSEPLNAAVCNTSEGNAIINTDNPSMEPSAELTKEKKVRSLSVKFPDNILRKMSLNLDLALGSTGSISIGNNKSIAEKTRDSVNFRVIQINSQGRKTLNFRSAGNGVFRSKLSRAVTANDKFLFEYGMQAYSKKTKQQVMSIASITRGKLKIRNSRR